MKAKKSLGQNFLVDQSFIRKIINSVAPTADQLILEIGPGHGALTEILSNQAGFLLAIELDHELVVELRAKFAAAPVQIVEADVLQVDLAAELQAIHSERPNLQPQARVVANLPYYISTAVLTQLIQARANFQDLTLMLQREVAERIASPPNNKDYGILSVIAQIFTEPRILFHVPPGAFRPAPKVDSSILRLIIRKEPVQPVRDEPLLLKVVQAAFSQRRKTIYNSLKSGLASINSHLQVGQLLEILAAAGIEPIRRAETLSAVEFVNLAEHFGQAIEQLG